MDNMHIMRQRFRIDIFFPDDIEDITWPPGDTKFLFKCWKYFASERTNEWNIFSTRDVIFTREDVKFSRESSPGILLVFI